MPENTYVFLTDSDSDLPYDVADARGIPVIKMPYMLNGEEYYDENGREGEAAQKAFFDKMRAGAVPVTACLSKHNYLEFFEPYLQMGKDILFVAFSSQMSATLQYAAEAREELLAQYPGRRIEMVDTLSISAPMTLLVVAAHDLYLQGKSLDEVRQWVLDNRMRAHAVLTVDSLTYLKRGGRLSPTSAFFGTMLDLKPIIVMGKSGKMDAADKVQGRKKAIRALVERTADLIENPAGQTLIIMHADAPEDAQRLAEMLRARIPELKNIRIVMVGPVIGAHCGPGTLASAFMGKPRQV